MELYNALIGELASAAAGGREFAYDEKQACPQTGPGTIILSRETAFELGGSANGAVGGILFTTDEMTDGIVLCGKDIPEISADTGFARLAVVSLDENALPGDDALYGKLKNVEMAKYHVYPENCLVRLSPESRREQLRVGKKAAAQGLSLKNIGFSFISEYKKDPLVKAVRIYFFTGDGYDYKQLGKIAERASAVTDSLNKILGGLEISCDTCELREICDEVEGLRQLHFGKDK